MARNLPSPRQFGSIVPGVFTPVLAKHSKSFSLIDCISVSVDRMQRNFESMRKMISPVSNWTPVSVIPVHAGVLAKCENEEAFPLQLTQAAVPERK